MVSKDMTINVTAGSDNRPVALLVQVASQYESKITVISGNKFINAKSIMGMMGLGLCQGITLTVTAEGEDEAEAIDHIEKYLTAN